MRKEFIGVAARNHTNDVEWWSLEKGDEAGNLSADAAWLEEFEGKRVRLVVETIDDGEEREPLADITGCDV